MACLFFGATTSLHVILFISSCFSRTFDDVQHEAKSLSDITVSTSQNIKKRYISTSTNFSPIRIYVHCENQTSLLPDQFKYLCDVVEEAAARIRSILAVIPVNGHLLLKRKNACSERLVNTTSQTRCSRLKPKYQGEFCENGDQKFQIPDDHLEGQDVYSDDYSSPLPFSIPNGQGVPNSDFILYVSAKQSSWCLKKNIVAYASYCQLDIHDRPVAGYVNFCAENVFNKGKFDQSRLLQAAIHEVFHTLGFSSELFSKYKDCQASLYNQRICYNRRDPVKRDEENGSYRIFLPTVAQEASKHFACSEDIGVPLERTSHGISSHWSPLVMYSSIMAPSFRQSDAVWIDNITLALFSDTGWYQVNYTAADNYPWAKGVGCDFLLYPECGKYPFLCNVSQTSSQDCTFSPEGKAVCKLVSEEYPDCGVWHKNDSLCMNNETSRNMHPFASLNSISSEGDCVGREEHNCTKVHIPVVFNHYDKLGKDAKDLNKLKEHVLEMIGRQVCIPKQWISNSSFTPSQYNGTYSLDLLIQPDINSTEKEFEAIMRRLDRFVPFILDASELVHESRADVPNHDMLFMKGWEAIVVLAGMIVACLILAIVIASIIQIKGKIRYTIMNLPETITQL